jgi:hypothetical protein
MPTLRRELEPANPGMPRVDDIRATGAQPDDIGRSVARSATADYVELEATPPPRRARTG